MTEKVSTINIRKGDEWETIVPAVAESAIKDGNGQTIALTYAKKTDVPTKTEVATALTDGSVTKIGTATLGSASKPIYLANGVPTVATQVVDTTSAQTIGWNAAKTFESGGGATGHLFFRQGERRNNNIGMIDAKNAAGEVRARIYAQTYGSSGRLHLLSHIGEHLGGISVGYKGDNTVATLTDGIPSNADSNTIVTKGFVADTTGGNNLMHRDGDESVAGTKTFNGQIVYIKNTTQPALKIVKSIDSTIIDYFPSIAFVSADGTSYGAIQMLAREDGHSELRVAVRKADGSTKYVTIANGGE